MLTIDEVRRVIREELGKGQGVDAEFKEICAIEYGDGGPPYEGSFQPETYTQEEELGKIGGSEPLTVMKAMESGWDEEVSTPLAKSEKRHADGVEIEKCGKQIWYYTYVGGAIVKSMVEDPGLPGGVMHFDEDGNEIETAA